MLGFGKKSKINKRVLLVEDDALLASVLVLGLKKAGLEVLHIIDGLEVLDAAKAYNPKVILLDLIIPGLDGFGVLRELKSDEKTEGIPVIVTSNLNNPSDMKSAKALGAQDYFVKANTKLEEIVNRAKKVIGV